MPAKPTLDDCWRPSRVFVGLENGERVEFYPVAMEPIHPAPAEWSYFAAVNNRPIHERDGDAAEALEALTALLRRHHQ